MTTRAAVAKFVGLKKLAVLGVSRQGKKFGNIAYKELKTKGYSLFPVHPNLDQLQGDACYKSLKELPQPVDGVLITIAPEKTAQAVRDAYEAGIKNIWIQQGSQTDEAVKFCRDKGLNCIANECILMFAEPVKFPHTIHRFVWRCIGKLPK